MSLRTHGIFAALSLIALAPLSAHAAPFTYSTAIGGAIPDNNAAGISSTITVPDNFLISEFTSVTITGLTHTWTGDLIITLTHSGTTVDIIDRVIGNSTTVGDSSNLGGNYTFVATGGADFNAAATALGTNDVISSAVVYAIVPIGITTTPGTFSTANGSLSNFNGLNANGTWTLNIADRAGADTGAFTGFSIAGNSAAAVIPEAGTLPLMLLAGAGVVGIVRRKR